MLIINDFLSFHLLIAQNSIIFRLFFSNMCIDVYIDLSFRALLHRMES